MNQVTEYSSSLIIDYTYFIEMDEPNYQSYMVANVINTTRSKKICLHFFFSYLFKLHHLRDIPYLQNVIA